MMYLIIEVPFVEKNPDLNIRMTEMTQEMCDDLVDDLHEQLFEGKLYQYKVIPAGDVPKVYPVIETKGGKTTFKCWCGYEGEYAMGLWPGQDWPRCPQCHSC